MFIFLVIFLFIIGICLIFGTPRINRERKYELEGIYDSKVAEAFDRMNKLYPFRFIRSRVVSKIKEINHKGKIVDLGCGSGHLLIKIAKNFNNVELIGIDISIEMLELAKTRVKNSLKDLMVEFKVGSAEKLPLPNNSVDFIVSTFSLHHWAEPIKAFTEIYRVLKKEGYLLIFDFRRDSRKLYHGFLKFITKVIAPKALKKVKEPLGSLYASYSLKELKELIHSTPFEAANYDNLLCWMFIKMKKI